MKTLTLAKIAFPSYVMIAAMGLVCAFKAGLSETQILTGLLIVTLSTGFLFERLVPSETKVKKDSVKKTLAVTFMNIVLASVVAQVIIRVLGLDGHAKSASLTTMRLVGEIVMAYLTSELIRYWIHYAQHHVPFLWRMHSIHHSVSEIKTLNDYYSHPVDYILRNVLATPILMLIGFDHTAIVAVVIFSTIIGSFTHNSANLKHGWLNLIFSTNELHRWHHSALPEEADNNFGASLIVWDHLFGTYYLPKDRRAPERTGI